MVIAPDLAKGGGASPGGSFCWSVLRHCPCPTEARLLCEPCVGNQRQSHWMPRIADRLGLRVLGVPLVALLVGLLSSCRPNAPYREECVALWNTPANDDLRAEVARNGYRVVEVGGAFVEGRYQGCFASFVEAPGRPWALYSATRIPGQDQPLRWVLDMRGESWGIDFPEPEPRAEPNALVLPNGSIRLRDS